jgi:hypothetical protein
MVFIEAKFQVQIREFCFHGVGDGITVTIDVVSQQIL